MKSVGIIVNANKDKDLNLTREIVDFLRSCGANIFLSDTFKNKINNTEYVSERDLFSRSDFIVTVGGDGTILSIAEDVSQYNIPVVGINLGRMGFMAELEPDEISLLSKLLTGEYTLDKRMMIDVRVVRNNSEICHYRALNDIVVSNGSISKMAELELYCQDTYVSLFHSDGLIVSTPTGSTAYSLSAGGAIIDPTINCLLLTPVCPHSFSNARPIIFSPKSILEIKDIQQNDDNTYLTIDGKTNVKLMYLDVVEVRASSKTVDLIKIKDKGFYDRVYQKISERK